MKKRPINEDSDEFDVDEPEEFEESGSDWDPQEDEGAGKKRRGRPKATQRKTIKKKKVEKPPSEDEEEEEDEEDEEEENEDEEEEEQESDEECAEAEQADANGTNASGVSLKAFTNGSFVVLKSDLKSKGNPPLWKIDGKALLQKYVPFVSEGKTLYKNTSTYSGWTPSNKDQYAAAPITYVQQGKKEIIIEFNKDLLQIGGKKKEGEEEEGKEAPAAAVNA